HSNNGPEINRSGSAAGAIVGEFLIQLGGTPLIKFNPDDFVIVAVDGLFGQIIERVEAFPARPVEKHETDRRRLCRRWPSVGYRNHPQLHPTQMRLLEFGFSPDADTNDSSASIRDKRDWLRSASIPCKLSCSRASA